MKKRAKKRTISLVLMFALLLMSVTGAMGDGQAARAYSASLSEATETPGDGTLHNPRKNEDGHIVWDTVYFGSYQQNSSSSGNSGTNQTEEKEPIRWRVLSVEGDDAFLMADKALDAQPYNKDGYSCSWATSSLRKWLNDDFLNAAFTAEEQTAISDTDVVNADNPDYHTDGGLNTTDKIYLLSYEEATDAEYGFESYCDIYYARQMQPTAYAVEQGAEKFAGNTTWWLRTPGRFSDEAMDVNKYGIIESDYYASVDDNRAVCPVMHLNISSLDEGQIGEPVSSHDEMPHNPTRNKDGDTIWDTIYFGSYWQNDTDRDGTADKDDEKEPIRWRVLSAEENEVFLMADKALDAQPYNRSGSLCAWKASSLRKWLNADFLQAAFTEEEQRAILDTSTDEEGSEDKVYLLSYSEAKNVKYGFSSDYEDSDRKAQCAAYAEKQGADVYNGYTTWYLRNTDFAAPYYNCVDYTGYFEDVYSSSDTKAIRPVLRLDLSSTKSWQIGKPTSSEGEVEPEPTEEPTAAPTEELVTSPTAAPTATLPPTAEPTVTVVPTQPAGTPKGPSSDSNGTRIWDTIYFGAYWQSDTNGDGIADETDDKEPIRWRVLSVDGADVLLIADKGLDAQPYNKSGKKSTWETSSLRSWLNKDFMSAAFTEEEQAAVQINKVVMEDNSDNGTEGGKDTRDKIYLLSDQEVQQYGFTRDRARRMEPTEYARTKGALVSGGFAYWWLRSPGEYAQKAAVVYPEGGISDAGDFMGRSYETVRPVLLLNLDDTDAWQRGFSISEYGNDGPGIWPTAAPPTLPPTATPTQSPVPTKPGESPRPTPTRTPRPTPSCTPTLIPTPTLSPTPTPKNKILTGQGSSRIYFGSYWQQDTNNDKVANKNDKKRPLRWRVLSIDGDEAFLLADKAIASQPYNESYENCTWETSSLREWLNNHFLKNAFTQEEQEAIRLCQIKNEANPVYGTAGGEDTSDKIFLLSFDEVTNPNYGFSIGGQGDALNAQLTDYALCQKDKEYEIMEDETYWGSWWLRTPGDDSSSALVVWGSYNGISYPGYSGGNSKIAVRPALRVDLSLIDSWKVDNDFTVSSQSEDTKEISKKYTVTRENVYTDMEIEEPATEADYYSGKWLSFSANSTRTYEEEKWQFDRWEVVSDKDVTLEETGPASVRLLVPKADVNLRAVYVKAPDPTATPEPTLMPTPVRTPGPSKTPTPSATPVPTISGAPTAYPGSAEVKEVDLSSYQTTLIGDLEEGESTYARYDSAEKSLTVTGKSQLTLKLPEKAGSGDLVSIVIKGISKEANKLQAYLADSKKKSVSKTRACTEEIKEDGTFSWEFVVVSKGEAESIMICVQDNGKINNLKLSSVTSAVEKAEEDPAQSTASAQPLQPTGSADPAGPSQKPGPTQALATPSPEVSDQPTVPTDPSAKPTQALSTPSAQPTQSTAPAGPPAPTKDAGQLSPTKAPDAQGDDTDTSSDKTKVKAPGKVKGLSVKSKKRTAKLKWKKVSKANGYQVQLGTSKKFKKKTQKSTKKTSISVKLKKGKKKYFVRVRAYTTSKGKKLYGKWSTIKTIKFRS